jgi:malate dehydrogenase (oxaloacetate-decarboxylating)(NADP+)
MTNATEKNGTYVSKNTITEKDALDLHQFPTAGKISIMPTKPLVTSRDLGLAYSPGVAYPCLKIAENPDDVYKYTSKGNMVAVISNGTAVLGLGNLGSAASKPVMEGKSVLFKRFANIDSVDVEINSENVEDVIKAVSLIGETWGGINLEDIKAPECFEIENRLKEMLDIPVFHDDQHGTAIITLAGLLNACEITGKKMSDLKVVMNGAGAAGIACLELIKKGGVKAENIILCDTKGPIYKGRVEGMNAFKEKYAVETKSRSLAEALKGADVFIGLSAKGAVSQEDIKQMAKKPIIFAMANPDPEITPEEVLAVIPDAIVATGRSDYPNQVNNVMGFPYIFRGALDTRARQINDEMKLAAAFAIAKLAKESVPNGVKLAYPHRNLEYGAGYIIPTPFDPRLIIEVSCAVAKAAIDTGMARKKIESWEDYRRELISHINPSMNAIGLIFRKLQKSSIKKKVVFAEGEEPEVVRSAVYLAENGYCKPILIGREEKVKEILKSIGVTDNKNIEILNASMMQDKLPEFIESIYLNLQRKGFLKRDCEKLVKTDRNTFAACLLESKRADAMLTGYTRGFRKSLSDVRTVISAKKDSCIMGFSIVSGSDRTILIGDTSVNENPSAEELAKIAITLASKARLLNLEPRVAFISYSNFGSRDGEHINVIKDAIKILDSKKTDFAYDGEMTVDVALSENPRKIYPFNKLSRSANILIANNLTTGNVSMNLIKHLSSNASVIGPVICGFEKNVQIVKYEADFESIINSVAFMLSEEN